MTLFHWMTTRQRQLTSLNNKGQSRSGAETFRPAFSLITGFSDTWVALATLPFARDELECGGRRVEPQGGLDPQLEAENRVFKLSVP